jgi:hypothetical protein
MMRTLPPVVGFMSITVDSRRARTFSPVSGLSATKYESSF